MPSLVRRSLVILSMLSLPVALVALSGGAASARVTSTTHTIKSTSLGTGAPTFTGPAATGCATAGCSLLTGPFRTPSTAGLSPAAAAAAQPAATANQLAGAAAAAADKGLAMPAHVVKSAGTDPPPPAVNCRPLGPGCDPVSMSAGGAKGVKGLNAVDSATLVTNVNPLGRDIEPPDQGLCANSRYTVETNNIGEIMVFDKHLNRRSSAIPLDTLMGLTARGWTSGGDPSCLFDYGNGGHWFFTEFVTANTAASGGPFTGCFAGTTPSDCFEGIAVTKGSNPFGPYNVYFVNANYNPKEPGYPYLLNDFAKISSTRDAFLLFYDEFPNNPAVAPGIGGGFFREKYALAIVSTISISNAASHSGGLCGPLSRGSRLDADHPENGVLIPCQFTSEAPPVAL